MHEMSIAGSILEAVRTEARRFPAGHVQKVAIRIGGRAGVDPEAVRFCFDVLVQDSELEPLTLVIDFREQGEDLDLAYLEVEDGAAAART